MSMNCPICGMKLEGSALCPRCGFLLPRLLSGKTLERDSETTVDSTGAAQTDVPSRLERISKAPSVSSSDHHMAGLRADGTVVAVGANGDGRCDVSDWNLK